MTTAELCAAYNVSRDTVLSWIAKGCPTRRDTSKRGRAAHVFTEESHAWIAKHTARRPMATPERTTAPTAVADPDLGLRPMLERARKSELATHKAIMRMKAEPVPDDVAIARLSRVLVNEQNVLIRGETALLEHEALAGRYCEASEVTKTWNRISTNIRGAVLALPSTLATLLLPHLTDARRLSEVNALLRKACEDVLHFLADNATEENPSPKGPDHDNH